MAALYVIAHAGHWITGLLYLAPVVIVFGWLGVQMRRDRRDDAGDAGDDPAP